MTKKQFEEQSAIWDKIRAEKPELKPSVRTHQENTRLLAFQKAKENAPNHYQISKRSAKKGISGFHKGVYMSQRGNSKFGKLNEDVPFPD